MSHLRLAADGGEILPIKAPWDDHPWVQTHIDHTRPAPVHLFTRTPLTQEDLPAYGMETF